MLKLILKQVQDDNWTGVRDDKKRENGKVGWVPVFCLESLALRFTLFFN